MTKGPVARLFGSLANALLDLGLPTIREWLRDRLGPSADVAQVTTDGAFVHLDGVQIPIGSRGLLSLDRATASVVGLGAAAPEIRLHAGHGVIVFGDDASSTFRATVSFAALPEPEESAWIWGQLEIAGASWTAREDGPPVHPMHGRARLFVSSREWRIEAGNLDGEIVRAHFVGAGDFEAEGAAVDPDLLVPRTLSAAALSLEQARVGPFLDAVGALAGRRVDVPAFVPLDARLDGSLAWSAVDGGTVDLRIASASIRATVRGAMGANGAGLGGQVQADVSPATILRAVGAPRETIPREEDGLHVDLDVGGSFRKPTVEGALRARELGFRLGRPRYVPPIVVRDLEAALFLKDGRAVVRAAVVASGTPLSLDLDASLGDPSSARGTLRADRVDAAFLRDLAATLGSSVALPREVFGTVELALAPTSSGPRISGTASVETASSKLVIEAGKGGALRVCGAVSSEDLLSMGLFSAGAVRPIGGAIDVDLDLDRAAQSATGIVGAKQLAVVVSHRPELAPWIVADATANVALRRTGLSYDRLRFRALGARFVARGAVPFGAGAAPLSAEPVLALTLEEGGLELLVAILDLVRVTSPPLPADLGMVGALELRRTGDGEAHDLATKVTLRTPRGSRLDLDLRLASGGLDGTILRGAVAISDLQQTNLLPALVASGGTIALEATVRGRGPSRVAVAALGVDRVVLREGDIETTVEDAMASVRVDRAGVSWRDVDAAITDSGGRIYSTGFAESRASVAAQVELRSVPVHDLPAIGDRAIGAYVRGTLSGSFVAWSESAGVCATGNATLEMATFPALDLLRPTLARYGLRPPNEDAAAPAKAAFLLAADGLVLRDIAVDLRGAALRGEVRVDRSRSLDGRLEVTLEEEYLRTSKMLTLPRVLTERLVVPIDVAGTLAVPEVDTGIGSLLGRFIKDSHVGQLFSSSKRGERRPPPAAVVQGPDVETRVAAHADDWRTAAELRRRLRTG